MIMMVEDQISWKAEDLWRVEEGYLKLDDLVVQIMKGWRRLKICDYLTMQK